MCVFFFYDGALQHAVAVPVELFGVLDGATSAPGSVLPVQNLMDEIQAFCSISSVSPSVATPRSG